MRMNETQVCIVIITMVALMLGALAGGLWTRHRPGKKPKGVGQRITQFVGLAWLIGATVILSVTSHIDGTGGTILAAVAGYLFGIRRRD